MAKKAALSDDIKMNLCRNYLPMRFLYHPFPVHHPFQTRDYFFWEMDLDFSLGRDADCNL